MRTATKPLMSDPSISPLVRADLLLPVFAAPFTDRHNIGAILFHFWQEAMHAEDFYGERKGRWVQGVNADGSARFFEDGDCPAAALRRQDTKALNRLFLAVAERGIGNARIRTMAAEITLHHTGDLDSRFRAFIARLA